MKTDGVSSKINNQSILAERRDLLVRAATRLFLRNGFHKTSVRDIANALGWNIGTLYLYIDSKEDVLFLILSTINRELRASLPEIDQGSMTDALRNGIRGYLQVAERMRGELNFAYREWASLDPARIEVSRNRELEMRDYFARIIERGIAAGEFRPVDRDVMAHTVLMLVDMWALKRWSLFPRVTVEEYGRMQTEAVLVILDPRRQPIDVDGGILGGVARSALHRETSPELGGDDGPNPASVAAADARQRRRRR